MPLIKVKLEREELWPYYTTWSGYGKPQFDLEVPEDLWNRYHTALGVFLGTLSEFKIFLKDD